MSIPRQTLLAGLVVGLVSATVQAQDARPAEPQTIVVSATRHAMALLDAPASMTVVTRAQIEARGADNVLDALRGETGVAVQGRTISGRRVLSLRGMDSRHTLILVDGKRIAASDGVIGHTDFQHDWIPTEDIERIEVIRGPMSVLYGAEALGGVVNIITRPVGTVWTLSTLVEASQADGTRGGDGHRGALRAAGPLGEAWRLALTATDVRRQRIDSVADARVSDLEGRHKRDAALQLTWRPAMGQRVEFEHRSGREERDAGARERSGPRRFYESVTSVDRRHTALGWSTEQSGGAEWRTLLRAYESSVDSSNVRNGGVAALRPNKPMERVLEGQASMVPAAAQRVTGGFELRHESLTNSGLGGGRGSARHRALYLQDEIEWSRSLAFTAGLRHDRHDMFGSQWSPRAYAVWKAATDWIVKGGVGHGFKAPTLKQISPGYQEDEGPFTYFANPALRPERNAAVELGAGWSTPAAGMQATWFSNRVRDLIITKPIGTVAGRGAYVFENVDRAHLRGLEAEGSAALGGGVRAQLNYQYLQATDGSGQRLEKRPRHTLGMRLDWARGAWRAGLRADRSQGQLLASLVAGQPLQSVPAVTLVGAHAAWQFGAGLELAAGVDNLTDLRLSAKSPLFIYAEPPRTWRLSLRSRW